MKRFGLLITIGIIVLILVVLGMSLAGAYNSLVRQSQEIEGQWAQVQTQYQRRFDLIPNLVSSVKGFMAQEKAIFDAIAEARTRYGQATSPDSQAAAASELETAVGRLLVIMENYPQLKSDTLVVQLMDELAGTENRISVERRRYNELVRDYNTSVKSFPTNIIAGMFGFHEHTYFESVSGADLVPKVEF